MNHPAPPLADLLRAAAQAAAAVDAGTSLTEALALTPPALRPGTQAIAFHAMRHRGTASAVADQLLARRPPSPLAYQLLLVALALLEGEPAGADARDGTPRYAAHTVVDQAVRATASRELQRYKALINGCLRRFLRERDALLAEARRHAEGQWNYPAWWVGQLRRDYPGQWQAILRAGERGGPLTLRVNRRRAERVALAAALRQAGVDSTPVGEHGLVLARARPVQQLPGFAQGWWSVQDAAAQLAAPLLGVRDGMRVLDACAAPGGKTAHLLELADVELLALDADPHRLARVGENLDRLGLSARLEAADAAAVESWWDGRPFDAVLADVPCTASGIVRRHPDIRWLRRHNDIARTAALQVRIADALWQVTAPGGTLLYATCSVFPAEGERQAQAFASRHADARRLDAPGQLLPAPADAAPHAQHDGFFYALFEKT
ncbi:16S rRNA (cytosine(967)-C(5))-methyltransferase RsmB [Verticiella sediminum]